MSKLLLLASLAFAFSSPTSSAPRAATAEHVSITARCEPATVQPGGFVDLVLEYQLDPGWHAVSPLSRNGPRVQLDLTPPALVARFGALRGFGGEEKDDAAFGKVVQITSKGVLRQHLRVDEKAQGKQSLAGTSVWVVCDAKSCLPPQKIPFEASFTVDARGARGPALVEPPPGFAPTAEETSACAARGFVARALPELAAVAPGGEVLVALDVRLEPGLLEDSLYIEPATVESGDRGGLHMAASGWRASMSSGDPAKGDRSLSFREILPLVVDPGARGEGVDLPLSITMKLKKPDGSTSLATQELRIALAVER